MLSSVLKIEKLLKCNICLSTLRQTRTLGDCGHRFCLDCITTHINNTGACATCQLTASMEDLKSDPMHDNLVSYVSKLKIALLSHSLTPLEDSLLRRDQGIPRKRQLLDVNTQESEDLEEEYRDDPKRFKHSNSGMDFIDELLSDRPVRKRNAPPPNYVVPLEEEDEIMTNQDAPPVIAAAEAPSLVGAPVEEQSSLLVSPPEVTTSKKARTPEPTETSDKKWKCTECNYENKSFMQICGICKKSKNRRVRTPIATRTRRASARSSNMEESSKATVPEQSLESATVTLTRLRHYSQNDIRKDVHIIQTSLTDEDLAWMDKSSAKVAETSLKVTVHTELKGFEDITHVISSVNNKKQCHRTLKYLHGILLGKWIVSPQWYVDSIKAKKWLPEKDYEVQGDARSGITHAPAKGRLEFSDEERLFQDMNFYLLGDFPEKHNRKDISILIQAGGGKVSLRGKPAKEHANNVSPNDPIDPNEPIILCSSATKKKSAWMKEYQTRDPSWLIDCISRLHVE